MTRVITKSMDQFLSCMDRRIDVMHRLEQALMGVYGTDPDGALCCDVLALAKETGWEDAYWHLRKHYDMNDPSQLAEALGLEEPRVAVRLTSALNKDTEVRGGG